MVLSDMLVFKSADEIGPEKRGEATVRKPSHKTRVLAGKQSNRVRITRAQYNSGLLIVALTD